jgi:hypothetical protein
MIGLYFKEGIKWIKWTSKYDYLVTRSRVMVYYGKVPDRVKDDYLEPVEVNLVRTFIQRLQNGDFYLKVERVIGPFQTYHYEWFLSFDLKKWYSTSTSLRRKYFEAYWFKHIVEAVIDHYVSEGEGIAGAILENLPFKLINHPSGVEVDIDLSGTYLPYAVWKIGQIMRGRKWVESVTWGNKEILMVNDKPVVSE